MFFSLSSLRMREIIRNIVCRFYSLTLDQVIDEQENIIYQSKQLKTVR